MSMPLFMGNPGLSYTYDNTMGSQSYQREDIPLDFGAVWNPDLVDPSLHNTESPISYLPEWNQSGQPMLRYLEESQKTLFSAGHMPSCQAQPFHMDFNRPHEALGSIPHACERSRGSPSSICSSTMSPRTESDWYHDSFGLRQNLEDCSLSRSISVNSQGPLELDWSRRTLPQVQMPSVNHINLSVVQAFADPQELAFQEQEDEGYMEMDIKVDCGLDADSRTIKQEVFHGHYRHSSDEGIGPSLKGEGSPEPNGAKSDINDDAEGDIDAEGEDVDEIENDAPVAEQEDQDTDYMPKTPRIKRRRISRVSPSSPNNKKNKVNKPVSRTKSQSQCKTCGCATKDLAALQKHVAAAHTRPFTCTFSFAGCRSTFGNKNEWKRHVSSQHLGLQYWLCDVGVCGHSKSSSSKNGVSSQPKTHGAEFNRKDLFTQHLRRMHAPFPVKRQHKKSADWDERVKELQVSCRQVRRQPPTTTRCPVRQCGQIFEGPNSWDDRMEHVGRHLEKSNAPKGDNLHEVIEQESDEFLIEWALKERIIERKMAGVFRLCSDASGIATDEDGDADCEDE